jgi:dUTP pyrophosphatase
MENKTKRFYKVGEMVWVISEKKEGKVKSINKDTLEVTVTIKEGSVVEAVTLKMWEIDKLKYKAKEQLVKKTHKSKSPKLPTVFFAKKREDAIIPSKRDEDAGYDVYANGIPEKHRRTINGREIVEIYCPAFTTTLVPTGIGMALPKTHYFNTKHERGSTGKITMSVLSGVIDSGYRGELFIAIAPLHKDVLITSEVTEIEATENLILYPYSKAIAQATIDLVPQVNIEEISFDELQSIESDRGTTALGQSGK